MAVKEHAVQERHVLEFLEEYAQALTSGDVARIADRWHVPCLVVSPQGVIAVSDRSQVEQFFRASVADYHAKGITAARLQDAAVTVVSSAVAAADVRWDHPSPDGGSLGGEHAYYVVSRGQDGRLGIDLYSPGTDPSPRRGGPRVRAAASRAVERRERGREPFREVALCVQAR